MYREREEEHFARKEMKRALSEQLRRRELDDVQRYLDADSPQKALERKRSDSQMKRLAESDRHEGRKTWNVHLSKADAEALQQELLENRRKSLTLSKRREVEEIRNRQAKRVAAVGAVEQMKLLQSAVEWGA